MQDDTELQDPGTWDFESGERRPGTARGRAVVSVAFPREDFERVAKCAEQTGKRLSEFIREAAVEKATSQRASFHVSSATGLGITVFTGRGLPSTGSRSSQVRGERRDAVRSGVTS